MIEHFNWNFLPCEQIECTRNRREWLWIELFREVYLIDDWIYLNRYLVCWNFSRVWFAFCKYLHFHLFNDIKYIDDLIRIAVLRLLKMMSLIPVWFEINLAVSNLWNDGSCWMYSKICSRENFKKYFRLSYSLLMSIRKIFVISSFRYVKIPRLIDDILKKTRYDESR